MLNYDILQPQFSSHSRDDVISITHSITRRQNDVIQSGNTEHVAEEVSLMLKYSTISEI